MDVLSKKASLLIIHCVQQWCIKRAKMKTTDDEENYMLPIMPQFFYAHRFIISDALKFSSAIFNERLNNYDSIMLLSRNQRIFFSSHVCQNVLA